MLGFVVDYEFLFWTCDVGMIVLSGCLCLFRRLVGYVLVLLFCCCLLLLIVGFSWLLAFVCGWILGLMFWLNFCG